MEPVRVLLVEDNRSDQLAFERCVREHGLPYDYVIAGSVAEARRILAVQHFDVAILDYFLGDGTAFDLLPCAQATPSIVVTATANETSAVQAMKAGAADYLMKDSERTYLEVLPVTVENILRRHRAEQALQQTEERLRLLVEQMPTVLWTTDPELRVTSAVGSGLRMLGLQPSTLMGMSLFEYLQTDDNGFIPIAMHQRALKGESVTYEHTWMGWTFACHIEPLRGADAAIIGTIGVANDITPLRAAQQTLERQTRLAAVGQLAAGIAHDFNNILTVVIAVAERLQQDRTLAEGVRRKLSLVAQEGHRAGHLIRQILDFSRRSVAAEPQPLDLSGFLQEFIVLLQRLVPEHIVLTVVIDPGDHLVRADRIQLEQVLTNLVVNARDAMPSGGELRITLSRFTLPPSTLPPVAGMQPGDWVALSLSDTGVGMPAEVLQHVFEPFFTTKEPGSGTGLGLAQVYGLVQQHRGFIDVSSAVGLGTRFSIYLPAAGGRQLPAPVPVREQPAPPVAAEEARGHGETILLVEDDPAVRDTSSWLLEGLGYQVLQAQGGAEALRLYTEHRDKIWLVLMDLVMPGISGEALCKLLHEYDPSLAVIVVSGYPLREQDAQLRGATAWLQKPVDAEQLAAAVFYALHQRPAPQVSEEA